MIIEDLNYICEGKEKQDFSFDVHQRRAVSCRMKVSLYHTVHNSTSETLFLALIDVAPL